MTRDEKDLFYILDNSDDFAHLTLKETSKYENYVKFSTLLKNLADLSVNTVMKQMKELLK